MDYENGAEVTLVAADGTGIKEKAYQAFGTDDNPSKYSQFMPDDWNSYNEHNSDVKIAESDALGFINGAKNVAIDMARPFVGPTPDEIEAFKQSKGYNVTPDEMLDFYNSGQKGLDYISDKSGEILRKASPYTKQFDLFSFASEIGIDALMLVDGLIGLTKVAVKGFSFLKGGLKIAESKGLGNLIEDIFKIKNDKGIVAGEKILEDMDLGGIKPEEIDLEGTETISRDSEIISDKDIYKDLEVNDDYREPEGNNGYKEQKDDYKTNEEENYNTKGAENAKTIGTGTVWDYIKATPSKDGLHSTYYEDSVIPRSFEITVDGQKMWVHGNGTKHINDEVMKQMEYARDSNLKNFSKPVDYINRINDENLPVIYKDYSLHTAITDPNYYSQLLLTDFKGALEKEISTNGIVYDKLRTSGNWEFKFAKPRAEGQLPVIKHAQFNGWGK
ncbi:hypothetical protein [Clostridium saccharoperbutylacetonicum]